MTYNDLVIAIETFANNHIQINSFYSGKLWNYETKDDNVYPSLVILPTTATIQKGVIPITFNIIVADILNDDKSNLDFVYSNTLQILGDLFAYLNNNDNDLDYYISDDGFNAEPFEESLDDILAGWIATIPIQVSFKASVCEIPMT